MRSGPEPTHFTTHGGTGFFFAQSGSRPVYQFTPKYAVGFPVRVLSSGARFPFRS